MNARKTAVDMVIKAIVSAEFMGNSNPLSDEQLGMLIRYIYRYGYGLISIEDCALITNDPLTCTFSSILTELINEIVKSWPKVG